MKVEMPAPLRSKFEAVHREVMILHFKWTYFLQLFGSKKAVDTLNSATGAIFKVIEDAMFYDLLLSLLRLLDPPKTTGRSNLSLPALAREIPDNSLRGRITRLESEIRIKACDMRAWRNRKLAHNDLSGHLAKAATLPSIQYNDLFEALKLLRRLMNLLHGHYDEADFRYDLAVTQADGKKLLFFLKYGLECWKEDKERNDLSRWKSITRELDAAISAMPAARPRVV